MAKLIIETGLTLLSGALWIWGIIYFTIHHGDDTDAPELIRRKGGILLGLAIIVSVLTFILKIYT